MKTLKRWFAYFVMRSLEIRLQDQREAMFFVKDEKTRILISLSKIYTEQELAKSRANYIALLPPGKRKTFDIA